MSKCPVHGPDLVYGYSVPEKYFCGPWMYFELQMNVKNLAISWNLSFQHLYRMQFTEIKSPRPDTYQIGSTKPTHCRSKILCSMTHFYRRFDMDGVGRNSMCAEYCGNKSSDSIHYIIFTSSLCTFITRNLQGSWGQWKQIFALKCVSKNVPLWFANEGRKESELST